MARAAEEAGSNGSELPEISKTAFNEGGLAHITQLKVIQLE